VAARRFFVLCGVDVLFAGLKPREVMPMAHTDQADAELRYGRPLAGLNPSPTSDRMDTHKRAPVLPPVHVVEGVIMLL
jgi:hypothetical protein